MQVRSNHIVSPLPGPARPGPQASALCVSSLPSNRIILDYASSLEPAALLANSPARSARQLSFRATPRTLRCCASYTRAICVRKQIVQHRTSTCVPRACECARLILMAWRVDALSLPQRGVFLAMSNYESTVYEYISLYSTRVYQATAAAL